MVLGPWVRDRQQHAHRVLGKDTRVRPSRDIDILFLLPSDVYWRFQRRSDNRQSQLLQEMKYALGQTYSQTTLRGDGQVVSVSFGSTPIEIVPGFRCSNGNIIICDTNDGGRYKTSTSEAEAYELDASDRTWSGNTRVLTRMMKQWQRERNVPLKSFQIERLAVELLRVCGELLICGENQQFATHTLLVLRAMILASKGIRTPFNSAHLFADRRAPTRRRAACSSCAPSVQVRSIVQ
jgi:SMODS domain-containing protein